MKDLKQFLIPGMLLVNLLLFGFIMINQTVMEGPTIAGIGMAVMSLTLIFYIDEKKRSISWDSLPSFINLHGCTLNHEEKLGLTLEIKNGVVSNVHIQVKDGSFMQKMRREIRAER